MRGSKYAHQGKTAKVYVHREGVTHLEALDMHTGGRRTHLDALDMHTGERKHT